MKIYLLILLVAVTQALWAQPIVPSSKPNKTQELMMERGYGMFIHFGINTFADVEWSDETPSG